MFSSSNDLERLRSYKSRHFIMEQYLGTLYGFCVFALKSVDRTQEDFAWLLGDLMLPIHKAHSCELNISPSFVISGITLVEYLLSGGLYFCMCCVVQWIISWTLLLPQVMIWWPVGLDPISIQARI